MILTSKKKIVTEAVEHCVREEWEGHSQWGFHGLLADLLFRCGAFFKHPAFAEEQEWRLVSPTITYHDERLSFRSVSSKITPYYRLVMQCTTGLPIKHVIAGPCPHPNLAQAAVTSLLMTQGLLGPLRGQQIVLNSKIPYRNW